MILRVIIARAQIIEPRFAIIIVSTIPERVDLGQITLGRNYLAPRGVDILCLQDAICINDLNNIALQIKNIIVGACSIAVNGVVKSERATGFVIEEVQRRGF